MITRPYVMNANDYIAEYKFGKTDSFLFCADHFEVLNTCKRVDLQPWQFVSFSRALSSFLVSSFCFIRLIFSCNF